MRPKVECILIKYNQPELESSTIEHVLRTARHENYSLRAHQNEKGVGLARIWNALIAQSDADYVCLLNTDTIPTTGWLDNMARVLEENADVFAVVPSSNRVHMSQIDVPFEDWEEDVERIEQFASDLREQQGLIYTLETCSAMCVLFRRDGWVKLQSYPLDDRGFDEDFQFYGEDTEFFYRAAKLLEKSIVWDSTIYVHHLGQRSMLKAHNAGELDYNKLRQQSAVLWTRKKNELDDRLAKEARK